MVSRRRPLYLDVLIGMGILALVIANVLPMFWGLLSSFKPFQQLVTYPPTLFDFTPTLANYQTVFDGGFMVGVRNSAVYALAAVALGLACGSIAAFGFDRFNFAGQAAMFMVIVASIPLAIGAAALLVPKYLYFTTLGLTNHW